MKSYRCVWEIDIDADSPMQAAKLAREIQLDPDNVADRFEVFTEGEEPVAADVLSGEIVGLNGYG